MEIIKINKRMMRLMCRPVCKLTASKKLSISKEVNCFFNCLDGDVLHDRNSSDEIYELYFSKEIVRFSYAECLRYILESIDKKCKNNYPADSFLVVISAQYGSCANITAKVFSSELNIEEYDINDYHQPTLIAFFGADSSKCAK